MRLNLVISDMHYEYSTPSIVKSIHLRLLNEGYEANMMIFWEHGMMLQLSFLIFCIVSLSSFSNLDYRRQYFHL